MSSPLAPEAVEEEAKARRRRILEAFEHVLDFDPAQRTQWLSDTFPNDPAMIEAVVDLVKADQLGPSALSTELQGERGQPELAAPERIGPYRLEA